MDFSTDSSAPMPDLDSVAEPGPEAARRFSGRRRMLAVLAAVVLVLIAGTAAVTTLLRHRSIDRFALPDSIGGELIETTWPKPGEDQQLRSWIDAQVPGASSTIAAVYVDHTQGVPATVVVLAAAGVVGNRLDAKLAQVFHDFEPPAVSRLHSVDVGNAKVQAECGSAGVDSEAHLLCVWVDPGSVGLVDSYDPDVTKFAATFRQIRDAIVTPGSWSGS